MDSQIVNEVREFLGLDIGAKGEFCPVDLENQGCSKPHEKLSYRDAARRERDARHERIRQIERDRRAMNEKRIQAEQEEAREEARLAKIEADCLERDAAAMMWDIF